MDRNDTATIYRKKISEAICFILKNFGYGDEMRRFRIQKYDEFAKIINSTFSAYHVSCCITGSKAEGLSLPLQADMDIMCVLNDCVCVDEPSVSGEFNILRAEYNHMSPPGYVHVSAFKLALHLSSLTSSNGMIEASILYTSETGHRLVSSSIFRNFFNQFYSSLSFSNFDYLVELSTLFKGPASTKIISPRCYGDHLFKTPNIRFDHVRSIPFYTSQYLDHWKERPRYHNWPTSAMLEEVAQSEGYIVPVGSAESNLPNLEWRVSYVTAEQKLMRSLNLTQATLFVVLKMISKELLGSKRSGISSYVMKNVVLWVCELYGRDIFVPELLLDQITTSLMFLKLCLENNNVPNYIIPERNLIAGRLNVQSKKKLICRLSYLMKNQTYIFYNLNIFRKHFHMLCMSPSCIQSYGKKRDTIEKLFLLELTVCSSVFNPEVVLRSSIVTDLWWEYFKDERFLEIRLRLINLIVPEWITMAITNPLDLAKLANERLKVYLS